MIVCPAARFFGQKKPGKIVRVGELREIKHLVEEEDTGDRQDEGDHEPQAFFYQPFCSMDVVLVNDQTHNGIVAFLGPWVLRNVTFVQGGNERHGSYS
jgi:hypothetical protein